MKYKYILFDADETLLDFRDCEEKALSTLLRYAGGEGSDYEKSVYKRINAGWWKRFEQGLVTKPQLTVGRFADTCRELGFDRDPNELSDYYIERLSEGDRLIDGALEVCRTLYGKCRMYIITNGIERVQMGRWSRVAIKDYFENIFISETIGYQKPRREYFDYVIDFIGNPPKSEILVVGDSLTSDIRGGIGAGLDTCWVNPEGKPSGDITPTYTIRSITECPDIIL
ncbi:MAG: noncanonical pyrimidine nucleotidase, YjjG family [Ruminococcaceae bacterium]|nr:noncanonical pyrimidine nucleotidase, YjjG family [Oscillospiraceae bacterium]